MGLDIYLYDAETAAKDKVYDDAWNAHYERPDYETMSDEERKKIEETLPQYEYTPHTEVASERYPDHYWNKRYLRSSYNSSGFNNAVPDFVGESHSLYWIFEPMGREWDGDHGDMTEDDILKLWECRKRALQVAEELKACDPLRVMDEGLMVGNAEHLWHEPPTAEQVLDWYREEKAKHDVADEKARNFYGDGGYSNAKGVVLGFEKGMEILALTVGRDVLGRPAAMAVYRSTAIDSYIQSAEICVEFIDEAVTLIKRDGAARMSWSG